VKYTLANRLRTTPLKGFNCLNSPLTRKHFLSL
jgi:hypothetical protein